eukprot:gnl/TRDRNA2_/TRDRNA2_174882_c2_seq5.p1 gnl/TRDRNA2_/TRDRNA2_174882_c2~~gnl/TRDRNA2_/TRDRNA2_174882_c2_seq5.p1  ORF type:complete len:628 (-),score=111.65 gnl/TRDRNA2_/TRDRNA2_174882_c2_seq5:454-2337(-)
MPLPPAKEAVPHDPGGAFQLTVPSWLIDRFRKECAVLSLELQGEISRRVQEHEKQLLDSLRLVQDGLAAGETVNGVTGAKFPKMVAPPVTDDGANDAVLQAEFDTERMNPDCADSMLPNGSDDTTDMHPGPIACMPEQSFVAAIAADALMNEIQPAPPVMKCEPNQRGLTASGTASSSSGPRKSGKSGLKRPGRGRASTRSMGEDEEDMKKSRLQRIVDGQAFELATGSVIVLNTVIMAVTIQYNGLQSGYDLKVPTFDEPPTELWPHADDVFYMFEIVFNACFAAELIVRFAAMRLQSLRSGWMWFDTIIVSFSLLDLFGLGDIGVEPSMMRLLRLARMIRMLKLLKMLGSLDALFLLIRSIQASLGALVWSFLLLLVMQLGSALVLCQLLRGYIEDETGDEEMRRRVFGYFGTYTNALLSMFEISLASWVGICRLLYSQVNELYAVFFIIYRCAFCFAVVKVITAVFIEKTKKAAAEDEEIMFKEKGKQKEKFRKKLTAVFEELNESCSGSLTREDWQKVQSDEYLKTYLSGLEIETQDWNSVFELLDVNKDGSISADEFVTRMSRLKGPAKSVDILAIKELAVSSNEQQSILSGTVEHRLNRLESKIDNLAKARSSGDKLYMGA